MVEQPVNQRIDYMAEAGRRKRNSWGAIFAGVAITVGIQLLLGMLGLAIGLTALDPEKGEGLGGYGGGGMIWWLISGLVALFIGGWTAGRLAGVPRWIESTLHGLIVWALATILGIYLLFSFIGAVVGGAWRVTAMTLRTAGQAVSAIVPDDAADQAWEQIRQEARRLVTDRPAATQPQEGAARTGWAEVEQALWQLIRQPKQIAQISDHDRQAVVSILVRRTGLSREQARQRVDRWVEQYEQAGQRVQDVVEQAPETARRYAGKAADVGAAASWWGFFMMLLGLGAAAVGGWLGTPPGWDADRPVVT